MGKNKEIFSFYKDIIDVDKDSVISINPIIISSIIYLLPINKSKNEKAPSYRNKINKRVIYDELKKEMGVKREVVINDDNYKAKRVEKIEPYIIYIKYGNQAYLDRFNEGLRNAFAHGNVYKKDGRLIVYNVDSGCKRVTLYFEIDEYKINDLLKFYKEKICKDDAKIRFLR